MPTVSQGSLPDMTEEVLGNFSAILESMDFAQELELLGIRKLHFRQRKRAIRELRAMGIGLWRLGLKRSFPSDGEFLFERFMLGLYEQAHTNNGNRPTPLISSCDRISTNSGSAAIRTLRP